MKLPAGEALCPDMLSKLPFDKAFVKGPEINSYPNSLCRFDAAMYSDCVVRHCVVLCLALFQSNAPPSRTGKLSGEDLVSLYCLDPASH
ncbi:hypothetical protein Tco_0975419 [Tanacetum coccineum]|uniref:Uncharacterized protein n=1 Tax=Tanacetum coccineum TaxID=301880 RepID=A0ABQ5EEM3_9ASTR